MATMLKRYLIAILAFIGQVFFAILQENNQITSAIEDILDYSDIAFAELIRIIAWTGSCFAGILVNRYGGATSFGLAIAINAILNLLSIPVLRIGYGWFVLVRFQGGIAQAFAFCALADIWSRWSPPEQRSRLMTLSYSASIFGTLMVYKILPKFDEPIESRFLYLTVSGVLPLIWSIIWLFIVKNDPVDDKSLSSAEKQYLVKKTEIIDRERNELSTYPWKSILTSKPVWILSITAFVTQAVSMSSEIQRGYTSENVHWNTRLNEIWHRYGPSSILITFLLIFGYVADHMLKRKHYTSTQIRKSYVCIGCVIGAIPFISEFFHVLDAITPILLIQLSHALTETAILVNVIELSPRYSAVLSGILKTFQSSAYLIGARFVIRFLFNGRFTHWAILCFSIASVLLLNALLFAKWGSAELQSWNATRKEQLELKQRDNEA